MTTTRKLENIASDLEDMSTTIEEIKDKVDVEDETEVSGKLDSLRGDLTRTAALIEESLETTPPAAGDASTPGASDPDKE